MKTFSLKVALAASLSITSVTAFAFIEDSILFYLKLQTENLFQGSFTQTTDETAFVFSYTKSPQVKTIRESSFETEEALHDILRKIAICR